MNFNAIHNILNLLGLIVGSLIMFDWASLGLSPEKSATIAAGFILADKVIKMAMNIIRDGLGGLFARQPPVVK
jgi:hypothetical protein